MFQRVTGTTSALPSGNTAGGPTRGSVHRSSAVSGRVPPRAGWIVLRGTLVTAIGSLRAGVVAFGSPEDSEPPGNLTCRSRMHRARLDRPPRGEPREPQAEVGGVQQPIPAEVGAGERRAAG